MHLFRIHLKQIPLKVHIFLLCSLLFCKPVFTKGQDLTPSTVRQIFSLQKGDSLEYHEWTVASGCGTTCNWYELKTVDSVSYNNSQDTLLIYFTTQLLDFDSLPVPVNPCGNCQQAFTMPDICPVYNDQWSIAYLDSSIVSYLYVFYGIKAGQVPGYQIDSISIDTNLYNGAKQNYAFVANRQYWLSTDIYVDSIGIVYKWESVEQSNNNREQLIYYHKANGSSWGIPFVNTGVVSVADGNRISVYPDPAEDYLNITGIENGRTLGIITNAIGQLMGQYPLANATDRIPLENLPAGYYQITFYLEGSRIGGQKFIKMN